MPFLNTLSLNQQNCEKTIKFTRFAKRPLVFMRISFNFDIFLLVFFEKNTSTFKLLIFISRILNFEIFDHNFLFPFHKNLLLHIIFFLFHYKFDLFYPLLTGDLKFFFLFFFFILKMKVTSSIRAS